MKCVKQLSTATSSTVAMARGTGIFFPAPEVTRLNGSEPVHRAIVRELPEKVEDCYWGWWDNEDQAFTHVYPVRPLVSMCLPYGIQAHEERGEGICLPVEIIDKGVAE